MNKDSISKAIGTTCDYAYQTTKATGHCTYKAVVNTPWAISETVNSVGQGITWCGRTTAAAVEGLGNASLWTLKSSGKVVTVTAATVAVSIGYPIATVGIILGSVASLLSAPPCWAASHPPTFMDRTFTPIESTARLADAALCPTFSAASAILLTAGIFGLCLGKLGRSAFK